MSFHILYCTYHINKISNSTLGALKRLAVYKKFHLLVDTITRQFVETTQHWTDTEIKSRNASKMQHGLSDAVAQLPHLPAYLDVGWALAGWCDLLSTHSVALFFQHYLIPTREACQIFAAVLQFWNTESTIRFLIWNNVLPSATSFFFQFTFNFYKYIKRDIGFLFFNIYIKGKIAPDQLHLPPPSKSCLFYLGGALQHLI